jgi:hypothetical protein
LEPLTQPQLIDLLKKIRVYRYAYWIYALSAVLYAAAAAALPSQVPPASFPVADAGLLFGLLVMAAVFLGRWVAFRAATLRAKGLVRLEDMVRYTFLTFLFLLAAGESLGMAAVACGSVGGGPAWKLVMLCLWQILAGLVLTPDRAHWDRLLARWEREVAPGDR